MWFFKIFLAIVSCAAFFAGTSTAYSEVRLRNVEIKKASSQFVATPVFNVVWKGNKLAVEGNNFMVPFQARADLNHSAIKSVIYSVVVRSRSLFGSGAHFQMLSVGETTKNFRFDDTLSFSQGHLTPVISSAIRLCQNHHKTADKGKKKTYPIRIPLDLFVAARHGFDSIVKTDETSLATTVNCPAIKPPKRVPPTPENQGLSLDHGAMKVNDIKLTFTTFQNGYTEPTPGTRCKKARLRVRLETNQSGFVSFKLWQQRGGGDISSKDYIIGSHHDGNGRFFAQKDIDVRVYKTTLVQANAKELISQVIQKETGWKNIHLICKGAGGNGGLAIPTDNDDDHEVPKSAFQGGFQLIDNSANAKQNKCTRNAKALVWFNNNKPDNIHYSLDCGALGNFSGTLKPASIGDGNYRGAKLIPFEIKSTIQTGCTLRTIAPGQPKDHVFQSREFTCQKTAGHGSGGGLAIPPPSAPKSPKSPKTGGGKKPVIDPVRTQISCYGGKVKRNRCSCPSNRKKVRVSRKVFKCVKRSSRVNPKTPKRTNPVICQGGKARGNRCICPAKSNRKSIGRNKFRCVKKRARVSCIGGNLRGARCYCPPRTKVKRKGRKTYVCVKNVRPTRALPPQPRRARPKKPRRVRPGNPRRLPRRAIQG